MTGSSESGVLGGPVFVSAMMILAWVIDPSGLDGVDLGRTTRTMVLSETQPPRAGLTLLRVLRKGLELGSCLGMTASRAYVSAISRMLCLQAKAST